jgi:hypothetical protein
MWGVVLLVLMIAGIIILLEYVIRHSMMAGERNQWEWDRWDTLTAAIAAGLALLIIIVLFACPSGKAVAMYELTFPTPEMLSGPPEPRGAEIPMALLQGGKVPGVGSLLPEDVSVPILPMPSGPVLVSSPALTPIVA